MGGNAIFYRANERSIMIRLSEGSGGKEMQELVKKIVAILQKNNSRVVKWTNRDDDSAVWRAGKENLCFTTDSYIVDPVFFPGGDIGKIAICGTINDLAVMGVTPTGISLGLVLEEGFSKEDLFRIIESIAAVSVSTGVPVVTGDTKVLEKGKVDKIIINTAGIGVGSRVLDKKIYAGDKVIVSGSIGEHGAAILAKRFDFESEILSDSKAVLEEIKAVKGLIKQAKDPTRGGIAATLNELCERNGVGMAISGRDIPVKKEVVALCDLLGIDVYTLACEGRFVCVCSAENAEPVVSLLRKFDLGAAVIGEIVEGKEVVLDTGFGKRILPMPTGNLVPRIC
jgi:hydrogenase expression/formation protein HypE